jgi:hypothetical protein
VLHRLVDGRLDRIVNDGDSAMRAFHDQESLTASPYHSGRGRGAQAQGKHISLRDLRDDGLEVTRRRGGRTLFASVFITGMKMFCACFFCFFLAKFCYNLSLREEDSCTKSSKKMNST